MNQMNNTPEGILNKVNEFSKSKEDQIAACSIINEFINNTKKKVWSTAMESLFIVFVELTINLNKIKYLKEGLNFYRGITQVSNIGSFIVVLTKTKELVEDKFTKALKTFKGISIDLADLDEEDNYLFMEDTSETKEKEDLVLSQKFIWDTYKILLDITKTNSKLFSLYSQILKAAFTFCRENKRTVEFKRLCDSVRNYLQTLIKSEKRHNFINKVQISHLDVLKILIQMRLNQIETATELEQWLESFKTAEDIVYLIDKYEKHAYEQDKSKKGTTGEKPKKTQKLNPLVKLEFYSNIEKLFWISNYPLYHAFANLMVRDIGMKAKNSFADKVQEKLDKFHLESVNDRIILSSLATPLKNVYTNYIKIGEDIYEEGNEIETETCKRMMFILKLGYVPSRNSLIDYIENNKINSSCSKDIQLLYNLFQNEKNPITLCKKAVELIKRIKTDSMNQKYIERIVQNIITKVISLFSTMYDSISAQRLLDLFSPLGIDEIELEDIICENSRIGLIKAQIDRSKQLIKFKITSNIKENLQTNMAEFLTNMKPVFNDINQKVNAVKFNKIRSWIYEEMRRKSNAGLQLTEQTMKEIKEKSVALKKYIADKNAVQSELKEKTQTEREEQKLLQIEKEKLEKEELKNAQKKKEYEILVKKYVIDNLRRYTNSILVQGKRIKLDDLLKDLNKVTEEEIIKSLEDQEKDTKLKKESKLKQITKKMDYKLREFRKKDNEKYKNILLIKEKEFNDQLKKESKEYYDEKIGIKAGLILYKEYKDKYFNDLTKINKEKYDNDMETFKTNLEKTVETDLYADLSIGFKKYFEDFKKKEMEEESKKPKGNWIRGSNLTTNTGFNRPMGGRGTNFEDNRPTQSNIGFVRGANVATVEKTAPMEFLRGAKMHEIVKELETKKITEATVKDKGFSRGSNVETPKEPIILQRGIKAEPIPEKTESKNIGFNRGAKLETPKETPKDIGFNRGSNTAVAKDKEKEKETPKVSTGGFVRGGNTAVAKDKEKEKELSKGTTGGFVRGGNTAVGKDKKK